MKMHSTFFIPKQLLLLMILLSSCAFPKKDADEYYPEVRTVSAEVQSDGSILVTGEIVRPGGSPVEFTGFCMDTLPNPSLSSNQKLSTSINNNTFTVSYTSYEAFKRYYFRAWAANETGYSFGETIYLDSITAPVVTPPCTPTLNTIDPGAGLFQQNVWSVSSPVEYFNEWTFTANASNVNLEFTFGEKPRTGIYSVLNGVVSPNHVSIQVVGSFFTGHLFDGELVYVNQLNASKWEITLCSAKWSTSGTIPSYLSGKFQCPK
jgi:hypothetical protein